MRFLIPLLFLAIPAFAQTPEDNALRIDALTLSLCNQHPTDPLCNLPPVANAGPDQTVQTGGIVTLDGSLSSDPDSNPLTYAWTLSRPAGSMAVLSDPAAITPDFTPDVAGDYIGSLTVNDGTEDSAVDTVAVTVTDPAPPPSNIVLDLVTPAIPEDVGHVDMPGAYTWEFRDVVVGGLVPSLWWRLVSQADGGGDQDHDFMVSDGNVHSGGTTGNLRFRVCTDGATQTYFGGIYTVGVAFDLDLVYDGVTFRALMDQVEILSVAQTGTPCNTPARSMTIGGQPGGGNVMPSGSSIGSAKLLNDETASPPPPPPPPPSNYDFGALRVQPNVVYSNGFEVGEDGMGVVATGTGRVMPALVDGAGYGGTRGAEITHDLDTGAPNTGGYGRVDWQDEAGSINGYMNFMFRSGTDPANDDALFENLGLLPNSNGTKIVQALISANTGHADSLNIIQSFGSVHVEAAKSQSGIPYEVITGLGDKNKQPLGDNDTAEFPANCTRRHVIGTGTADGINYQAPPRPTPATIETYSGPCVLWRDYEWINVEFRFIQGQPFALWIDRNDGNGMVKVIERSSLPIVAAYNNVVMQSYHTDFQGPAIDKFLRVRYDNFIVSRDCIRSCGL